MGYPSSLLWVLGFPHRPLPACTPPSKDLQGKQFPHPIPSGGQMCSLQGCGAEPAQAAWGWGARAGHRAPGLAKPGRTPLVRNVDAARAGPGRGATPWLPAGPDSAWVGREAADSAGISHSALPTWPLGAEAGDGA